jgi:branched-chain amino acid aminotransferase
MDSIIGNCYVIDNKIFDSNLLNYQFDNSDFQFYEVIRINKGVLIFIDDHLQRLYESLKSLGSHKLYNVTTARECLDILIRMNENREGNIKLLCKVSSDCLIYASYYISHNYPSLNMYEKGVNLKSYMIERKNPQIKQVQTNEFIKKEISSILVNPEFYEVLLINNQGYITEGSKSNFFLIKGNKLYSAPESWILKGITRKHVLRITKELGLKTIEKKIKLKYISYYDAAFVCGTSPKVLPVKKIDELFLNPHNLVLKLIISKFNVLLNKYIEEHIP